MIIIRYFIVRHNALELVNKIRIVLDGKVISVLQNNVVAMRDNVVSIIKNLCHTLIKLLASLSDFISGLFQVCYTLHSGTCNHATCVH
jgi:hypothetical protein